MCQPLSQTQHDVYIDVFVVVDSGFRHDKSLVLCVLVSFSFCKEKLIPLVTLFFALFCCLVRAPPYSF